MVKQLDVGERPTFARYNPEANRWETLDLEGLPLIEGDMPFRNGTALAWDHGDYIYALLGARYEDANRRLFYRYSISNGRWEKPLKETPYAQGAGDALTWSGYDNKVYVFIGSNGHGGSIFASYDPQLNEWQSLKLPDGWGCTDDGASLVWTGGEYLYALQGSDCDDEPSANFARFHIPAGEWVKRDSIPQGVDDGGSLLWIGGWLSDEEDYIYALSGAVDEKPGYDFYRYIISQDRWKPLEDVPCPIGWYNGNRLGFADDQIYYWQGSPKTDRWQCRNGDRGGKKFYKYEFVEESPGCFYLHLWSS